jgi:hypothetical protein
LPVREISADGHVRAPCDRDRDTARMPVFLLSKGIFCRPYGTWLLFVHHFPGFPPGAILCRPLRDSGNPKSNLGIASRCTELETTRTRVVPHRTNFRGRHFCIYSYNAKTLIVGTSDAFWISRRNR